MNLILVNEHLPYASTTFYTLDLSLALQNQGDDVCLCTRGGDLRDVLRDRGIKTHIVKLNLFSFHKLLSFLRDFRPDLIHIQNVRSVQLGQKISRSLRIPHVLTVHRVPPRTPLTLEHNLLAGVIALNEMIRASLVNEHGIPKNIIRVMKHGVNVEAFSPKAAKVEDRTGRLPVLGSIGRLTEVKGHEYFLRAARRVLDEGVEAMFMIVGEGYQEGTLRRIVKELKMQDFVTFLPHMPSRRELYRIFDIIVVPTLRGGVGATALEAMAMAKPVVASAVGELLGLITNGENGLLVEEKNPDALAGGMIQLIRDPDFAARLGKGARQFVCDNFALSAMVKNTREFYDEVQNQLQEEWLEH